MPVRDGDGDALRSLLSAVQPSGAPAERHPAAAESREKRSEAAAAASERAESKCESQTVQTDRDRAGPEIS
jgi:hypothetical protein